MSDESKPRYTLDEAERLLAERDCRAWGHDYQVESAGFHGGPRSVLCRRCGRTWDIDPMAKP